MAVRGIDTQIMVTRSADLARDVGALVKKPELTQEQLAALHKMTAALDQKKVMQATQPEMDKVRTDEDRGHSDTYQGSSEESSYEEDNQREKPSSEMYVPPGDNVIDIKV